MVAGLDFRPMHIPLAAGLNQGADERALEAPALLIAKDVQFNEAGGVQLRYPFEELGDIGGLGVADVRRVVANGNELLAFTADSLYSYDEGAATWRLRGTHLAVKVEETSRFVTPGDQINCDRAELGSTVAFCWEDSGTVYYATIDRLTGTLTTAPTSIATAQRPKVVALTTKILLFYVYTGGGAADVKVVSIDPTTLVVSAATTILGTSSYYDAQKVPGLDTAAIGIRRQVTASYTIGTVTAGLVVTTSSKARTCDGPIAISVTPTGGHVQVVRGNGTNVQGDLIIVSSLVDVYTAQAIGTVPALSSIDQIAAAHRSVQDSGEYRCYAFWDHNESTSGTDWSSYSNWVDTGNTLGTAARFVRALGLASRAFDHGGRVFFWGVFAGTSDTLTITGSAQVGAQLQNTYFLYRDDGLLVAKAAAGRAGGFISSTSTGLLPSVTPRVGSSTSYAWAGLERRIVPLGGDKRSYADRGPRDFAFTFDSNEARRCVRLGNTLYITGGEILQYDGVRLTEVGFHVYPWYLVLAAAGGTTLPDGDYFYRSTLRWENAGGDVDRSTTATVGEFTLSGGPADISLIQIPLYITHKTANPPAIEWWRTPINPDGDVSSYLVTKKDPASTSNPNRYLANDTTAAATSTVTDALADVDLLDSEQFPENGAELENLAPPPATVIAASADRVFLAGVAGDPDRVWYSKQRLDGRVASFNDALTVTVPQPGGAITALAFLNETLVVFRERALYVLPGDGFDNTGGGQNYGPARTISLDVGALSAEAVAVGPEGIVFKSSKGWQLLDRSWSVRYIGGPVDDYDDEEVVAVHVVETSHQIRCCTTARILVFDYQAGQWAEWEETPVHACMWRGAYVLAREDEIATESDTYTNVTHGIDIETAWIKPGQLQGFVRVTKLMILGEYRSACYVRVRVAYNYEDAYVDDRTWEVSPTVVGGPMQLRHGPSRQQCQAIKVRITATDGDPDEPVAPSGEGFKLSGLALEVGLQRGLKRLPAAQKQ